MRSLNVSTVLASTFRVSSSKPEFIFFINNKVSSNNSVNFFVSPSLVQNVIFVFCRQYKVPYQFYTVVFYLLQ